MNISNIIPQAYISSTPDSSSLISCITAIGFVIIILVCMMAFCVIAALFIILIIYVFCECICWPIFERSDRDIEMGLSHRARIVSYRAELQNDLQLHEIPEGLPQVIKERQVLRQNALEKLLPSTHYRSDKLTMDSVDCAICLDAYMEGELCRVLPKCNHMFHLNCIDSWLKNHLTCPICRKCILEA